MCTLTTRRQTFSFLSIIFVVTNGEEPSFSKCNKNVDNKADSTVSKLIRLTTSAKLAPESQSEIEKRCRDDVKYLDVLSNYTKTCLNALPRQMFGTFIFTAKRNNRLLCRSNGEENKRRQQVLKYAKCGNSMKPVVKDCYNQLLDFLVGIENDKSDKSKIPYICCTLNQMFRCVFDKSDSYRECSAEAIEYIRERVLLIRESSAAEALCREYDDSSDKCDSIKIPVRSAQQRRPKSFLFPAIKILLTLARVDE